MIVQVKVTAHAKKNDIKIEAGIIKVYLTAPAVEGKANRGLIDILANHYKVKRRQIEIIKGLKSPYKTINIKVNLEI